MSHIPGTTRDIIESAINIAGYPVLFSDTAGLRDTDDIVEIEGVKRALQKYRFFVLFRIIEQKNFVLLLVK